MTPGPGPPAAEAPSPRFAIIDAVHQSGNPHLFFKHFVSSSGTTLERIRVDAARKFYLVYWNTGEAVVNPASNWQSKTPSGGAANHGIELDPLAAGSTNVAVTAPGSAQATAAVKIITVGP